MSTRVECDVCGKHRRTRNVGSFNGGDVWGKLTCVSGSTMDLCGNCCKDVERHVAKLSATVRTPAAKDTRLCRCGPDEDCSECSRG